MLINREQASGTEVDPFRWGVGDESSPIQQPAYALYYPVLYMICLVPMIAPSFLLRRGLLYKLAEEEKIWRP